jgi:proteasome lid subunit RPN8/RPN11
MSKSGKDKQANLRIRAEVARQIRQHARSSPKTEVCGVLIGEIEDGTADVQACISGANAAQGGAHVTFTQDTWEHIYKIKDRDFPDARIVGWYHSHPGFGIFLSDHDTFIHKNFFSAPEQVAWVIDPHTDEEGCFGWRGSRLERIARFSFVDDHGGESANVSNRPEPRGADGGDPDWNELAPHHERQGDLDADQDLWRLARTASTVFSHLVVFLIGALLVWYFLPRPVPIPIPVDPVTGLPTKEGIDRLREIAPHLTASPTTPSPEAAPALPDNSQSVAPNSHTPQTGRNDGHP